VGKGFVRVIKTYAFGGLGLQFRLGNGHFNRLLMASYSDDSYEISGFIITQSTSQTYLPVVH